MNRILRVSTAFIGLAVLGASAQAESLIFKENGPLGQIDAKLNGSSINNLQAGWLKFGIGSINATDFLLCTEITQKIAPKGEWKDYNKSVKSGSLGWLLNQYDQVTSGSGAINAAKAAGLQIAVWEVAYEGEGGNYNLGNGKFKVVDGDNTLGNQAISYAKGYLNALGNNKADYFYYQNSKHQDMVGAVPEPGTMAALGLGALFLRRRKKKNA